MGTATSDAGPVVTVLRRTPESRFRTLRVLTGRAARLGAVRGISVDSARRMYLTSARSILVHDALVPKQRPSKVRRLRVTGKVRAAKRTVRWKKPKVAGSAPVTGYRVVVKKVRRNGKVGRTLVSRTVGESKRSTRVRRAQLKKGRHVVRVRAVSVEGKGKVAKERFTVRRGR